jgi:3-deoxy-7-phosphoheptulonate synthase
VPVLLKRGMSATLAEYLLAAEHVMKGGNSQVILCERGIRTFEPSTRNTLDIGAVPMLKRHTHLPVIVDPSHGTGVAWMVGPMACAAIAAGADGLLIEVHAHPERALSDGGQSLSPGEFAALMPRLAAIAEAAGRSLA